MTTPQGPGGPRPQGPAGPAPARPTNPPQRSVDAIVAAAKSTEIQAIAASLPDLSPSAMDRVADIWRRCWRLGRFDRAA